MSGTRHTSYDRGVSVTGPRAAARRFDVVVLVASLGGLRAVSQILAALPDGFPAQVLVGQHGRRDDDPDRLARLIQRLTPLPVRTADGGAAVGDPGVLVVPPGHVAGVDPARRITVVPAVDQAEALRAGDVLMAGVAEAVGTGAIGVVLTGMLHDGSAGVRAIKRHGGRVLVQEPATARASSMPASAIATGCVDFVLPLERIPAAIVALTMAPGGADLFTVPVAPWARLDA